MINIPNDLKIGDRVFFWYSPFKTDAKVSKKNRPVEHEFKVSYISENRFAIESIMGGYNLIFTKDLLDTMIGECKKAHQ